MHVPLFFLISGYFAHRALARPWGTVLGFRVGKNLYIYVLWVALLGLFFHLVMPASFGGGDYTPSGVLAQLIIPVSHPWYMYALALYFLVAKALRQIPAPLVLGGASIVFVKRPGLPVTGSGARWGLGRGSRRAAWRTGRRSVGGPGR